MATAASVVAQPLSIERIDLPESGASGDAIDIALTAHVYNHSDTAERYSLAVVPRGSGRSR